MDANATNKEILHRIFIKLAETVIDSKGYDVDLGVVGIMLNVYDRLESQPIITVADFEKRLADPERTEPAKN